jgi:probable phosphoglycerate mutase
MSLIYWVRHGENWANLSRELSTRQVDYNLTPRGRTQAAQTADYFRNKAVDAVLSSPLKRAIETAQPIARGLGLPMQVVEEFRELNVGALERKLPGKAEWDLHDNRLFAWLDGRERDVPFPEGEDYHILMKRLVRGLRFAARWERTVVVAHGGLLFATLPDLVGGMDKNWTRENGIYPNCAVSEFETVEEERGLSLRMRSWAYHDHLSGDAAVKVSGVPKRAGRKRPMVVYVSAPREPGGQMLRRLAAERPGWYVRDHWPEDGLAETEMVSRAGTTRKWGLISLFARLEQALRECDNAAGILLAGPGQPEDMRRAAELFALDEWQVIEA